MAEPQPQPQPQLAMEVDSVGVVGMLDALGGAGVAGAAGAAGAVGPAGAAGAAVGGDAMAAVGLMDVGLGSGVGVTVEGAAIGLVAATASASASVGDTVTNMLTDTPDTNDNSETKGQPLVTGTSAGSVAISLHPLVIMNISEHWTRLRAQEGSPQPAIGALIGKQKGRNIELMNSFELVFSIIGGDLIIDRDYYAIKEEQFKQVFSDMDFLGWYTTGESPTEKDIAIHKQICEINESPILLQLNPNGKSGDQLPVCLYESVVEIVGAGEAALLLAPLRYTLAAEEAERVGVDHVARVSASDAGESSLVAEHLTAQRSAIRMVAMRVRLVARAIAALRSGELPPNPALLREARALAHRLPLVDNPIFTHHFYNQCNDVGLMTYLGSITKGCNDINQFVNKFNILYDKQAMGRRMRGIFF